MENPTNLGFTDKATVAIVAQIAGQITAKFQEFLGPYGQRLLNTLPGNLDEDRLQKGQVEAIITEMAALTQQLNEQIPGVECAQAAATASLQELAKRDREVSDKLKESFAQVKAQLAEMKILSEAVSGAQREIHIVVARQKADLESVRMEVGT